MVYFCNFPGIIPKKRGKFTQMMSDEAIRKAFRDIDVSVDSIGRIMDRDFMYEIFRMGVQTGFQFRDQELRRGLVKALDQYLLDFYKNGFKVTPGAE